MRLVENLCSAAIGALIVALLMCQPPEVRQPKRKRTWRPLITGSGFVYVPRLLGRYEIVPLQADPDTRQ